MPEVVFCPVCLEDHFFLLVGGEKVMCASCKSILLISALQGAQEVVAEIRAGREKEKRVCNTCMHFTIMKRADSCKGCGCYRNWKSKKEEGST